MKFSPVEHHPSALQASYSLELPDGFERASVLALAEVFDACATHLPMVMVLTYKDSLSAMPDTVTHVIRVTQPLADYPIQSDAEISRYASLLSNGYQAIRPGDTHTLYAHDGVHLARSLPNKIIYYHPKDVVWTWAMDAIAL